MGSASHVPSHVPGLTRDMALGDRGGRAGERPPVDSKRPGPIRRVGADPGPHGVPPGVFDGVSELLVVLDQFGMEAPLEQVAVEAMRVVEPERVDAV